MGKKRNNSRHVIKKKMSKRSIMQWIVAGFLLVALSATAVVISSKNEKTEYDLSVIGNGKPTVVQIHDPKCQLCNRLKRVVGNVKGDFDEQVQFRIANIKTEKGEKFADRYDVSNVTLLFFDKKGRHVNTLEGVSGKQLVTESIEKLLK